MKGNLKKTKPRWLIVVRSWDQINLPPDDATDRGFLSLFRRETLRRDFQNVHQNPFLIWQYCKKSWHSKFKICTVWNHSSASFIKWKIRKSKRGISLERVKFLSIFSRILFSGVKIIGPEGFSAGASETVSVKHPSVCVRIWSSVRKVHSTGIASTLFYVQKFVNRYTILI